MSFPTTSVLTSFTGADENPLSESSNWGGVIQSGTSSLKRLSNQAAPTAATTCDQYWSVSTFGADTEVFVDVPVLPNTAGSVQVWARIQNPGNASTMTCYTFIYKVGTGFQYFKITAGGTFTQKGTTDSSHTLAAGESIGFSVTGSGTVTLQGYYKSGGVWTPTSSATDSTSPINTAGNIGLCTTNDTVSRADNFGGGTVVVGGGGGVLPTLGLMGVGV